MALQNSVRFLLASCFPRSCWSKHRCSVCQPPHPVWWCLQISTGSLLPLVPTFRTPMSREDTALVCGIYGLDIFWHLLCFPTRTPGKAGQSVRSCCCPAPGLSFPCSALPACADTSVWARLAAQAGGWLWDTCSHHRYFCPSYNFSAVKQSFLGQQSCEQSWALVSSEWRCFTSCHCSPQSTRQWCPPCSATLVCEDVMFSRHSARTDGDLGQRDHN